MNFSEPKVTVIVLNWNGLEDTLECIKSLKKVKYSNFEIVVVDNGSSDGSTDTIRQTFPNITCLGLSDNRGFAAGNNFGIKYALNSGAEYVLLLNNDTIVDPCFIKAMVSAAQSILNVGFLGAKIYYYDEPERIWFAKSKLILKKGGSVHIGQGVVDDGLNCSKIEDVDYICGCTLLMKASVIRDIGLMDERFFLTFEDTDWSYRAREAGYRVLIVPDAHIWHKVSRSFGGKSPMYWYFYSRNRLLWAKKHLSYKDRVVLYMAIAKEFFPPFKISKDNSSPFEKRLWWAIVSCWRYLSVYKSSEYRARLLGIRDYLLGRFGRQEATTKKFLKRRN